MREGGEVYFHADCAFFSALVSRSSDMLQRYARKWLDLPNGKEALAISLTKM